MPTTSASTAKCAASPAEQPTVNEERWIPKVFILGSCVSRDALEFTGNGVLSIAAYLARTSMASIGMPAVKDTEVRQAVAGLTSSFQRRMLLNDLDKSTLLFLSETSYDVLLLDFIDERFNLVRDGSTVFSLSGELQNSGFKPQESRLVPPGSDTFLELWLTGLGRLLANVDEAKIIVNRAYWAESFPDGNPVSSMSWIRNNNALLARMYTALTAAHPALQYVDYPADSIVANPAHRWGVAPYHYTNTFYSHTVAELLRQLSENRPTWQR